VLRPPGFGVDWDWVGGQGFGVDWPGRRMLLLIHFLSVLLFIVISLFIFIIKREIYGFNYIIIFGNGLDIIYFINI
jgi:hypothetical protein